MYVCYNVDIEEKKSNCLYFKYIKLGQLIDCQEKYFKTKIISCYTKNAQLK